LKNKAAYWSFYKPDINPNFVNILDLKELFEYVKLPKELLNLKLNSLNPERLRQDGDHFFLLIKFEDGTIHQTTLTNQKPEN